MTTAERKAILLSTAYFPPIQYFSLYMQGDDVLIEGHENYSKQTYRNRCKIYAPGGVLHLSVPVERGSFHKVKVSELKIDYSKPWINLHLRALRTAYNSSAFYEFYIDDIERTLRKNHKKLIDLNTEILLLVLSMLEIENKPVITEEYLAEPTSQTDYRDSFSPKKEDPLFIESMPEYFQVFSPEKGFVPNLSILDLIFNKGPEAYSYLLGLIKKDPRRYGDPFIS